MQKLGQAFLCRDLIKPKLRCVLNPELWILCLIDLLDVEDVKIVKEALKRIGCCLRWGKKLALNDENGRNRFLVELENKGGIEKVKGLLENKMYCGQVKKIWEDYFDND